VAHTHCPSVPRLTHALAHAARANTELPVRLAVRQGMSAQERPYLITKQPGGGGALSGIEPRSSVWGKIAQHVFGL
jgi:hypothetical protein